MNETNLTKEDFWMKRIQDFQKSGLSRKEWCQENQVPLSVDFQLLDQKTNAEAVRIGSRDGSGLCQTPFC